MHSATEGEILNPAQKESLNSELQIFFYVFSRKQQRVENNNSRKYFIFSTQVGKAWHFIFKITLN
jgi:hypothetical protein